MILEEAGRSLWPERLSRRPVVSPVPLERAVNELATIYSEQLQNRLTTLLAEDGGTLTIEKAEGKQADARSDIFSLGVVFYEMLTGQRPFGGTTPTSTLSSILRDTPRPVTELQPSMPRELARLVHRCLAKNAVDRYQSALDVRHSLEEAKQDVDSGDVVPSHVARREGDGAWPRGDATRRRAPCRIRAWHRG